MSSTQLMRKGLYIGHEDVAAPHKHVCHLENSSALVSPRNPCCNQLLCDMTLGCIIYLLMYVCPRIYVVSPVCLWAQCCVYRQGSSV